MDSLTLSIIAAAVAAIISVATTLFYMQRTRREVRKLTEEATKTIFGQVGRPLVFQHPSPGSVVYQVAELAPDVLVMAAWSQVEATLELLKKQHRRPPEELRDVLEQLREARNAAAHQQMKFDKEAALKIAGLAETVSRELVQPSTANPGPQTDS